jgi:hypothetical protein
MVPALVADPLTIGGLHVLGLRIEVGIWRQFCRSHLHHPADRDSTRAMKRVRQDRFGRGARVVHRSLLAFFAPDRSTRTGAHRANDCPADARARERVRSEFRSEGANPTRSERRSRQARSRNTAGASQRLDDCASASHGSTADTTRRDVHGASDSSTDPEGHRITEATSAYPTEVPLWHRARGSEPWHRAGRPRGRLEVAHVLNHHVGDRHASRGRYIRETELAVGPPPPGRTHLRRSTAVHHLQLLSWSYPQRGPP